jgi:hypothetical protein
MCAQQESCLGIVSRVVGLLLHVEMTPGSYDSDQRLWRYAHYAAPCQYITSILIEVRSGIKVKNKN